MKFAGDPALIEQPCKNRIGSINALLFNLAVTIVAGYSSPSASATWWG